MKIELEIDNITKEMLLASIPTDADLASYMIAIVSIGTQEFANKVLQEGFFLLKENNLSYTGDTTTDFNLIYPYVKAKRQSSFQSVENAV